eukprot:m.29363 g.29363  ORF g.29363 m.29363 type:complete len:117 (-) comp6144_c1_seq1:1308-1658(-)
MPRLDKDMMMEKYPEAMYFKNMRRCQYEALQTGVFGLLSGAGVVGSIAYLYARTFNVLFHRRVLPSALIGGGLVAGFTTWKVGNDCFATYKEKNFKKDSPQEQQQQSNEEMELSAL